VQHNGHSSNRSTLYLIKQPYYLQKLLNWLMRVKDIACKAVSFSRHGIQHDWTYTIFGVLISSGSAETLVTRGGITNTHPIAYSLSNISANNYQNRLMCVEVIVCNIGVVFWDIVYIESYVTVWLTHWVHEMNSLLIAQLRQILQTHRHTHTQLSSSSW